MALVSILLAVLAFGCTVIGFLTTPIPVVGVVFSFGAAAIALAGIMLGGRATSAAKTRGLPTDAARIAVVLNVLAFVPALSVAFTCGVCNAVMSTGNVHVQKGVDFGFGPKAWPGLDSDAGAAALPPPERARDASSQAPDPGSGTQEPRKPREPARRQPAAPPSAPNAPGSAPSLPPPPLPPGPGR
jgi:hypothetical protein